ncbi:MAG: GTPase ObgE [Bacilli bacterium]|nr:GTPase ObgE [Bacilli bacterium]
MFIDRCKIEVRSGKGGDGAIAFRHEKYVANGGPSGGNGGRGGSIIFRTDKTMNSLFNFRHSKAFIAQDGEKGDIKLRYGKNAPDVIVNVPVGTVVLDAETHELLFDLNKENMEVVVVKGGRGGRGNAAFKSDRNRVPRIAENGLPGINKKLILELKLIADVGLVGLPNAGKSTLLSLISEAKPEIADYPFTTITPNLGVVNHGNYQSFVVADLPGLIEDAHKGKGLGLEFLRHVERCRVIIHVVSMEDGANPVKAYQTINEELKKYDPRLVKRPTIIAASKMDEDGADEKRIKFIKAVKKKAIGISALTNEGLDELLNATILELSRAEEPKIKDYQNLKEKVYDARKEESLFTIVKEKPHQYRILGDKVLRTYSLINISTDEGMLRLITYLRKIGVDDELEKKGVSEGDTIYLGDFAFEYIK